MAAAARNTIISHSVNQATAQAQEAATSAAAGGTEQGPDDEGQVRQSDGEEKQGPRAHEPKATRAEEFFDDMMEGFAEIYRQTVGGGQACADCVRRGAYPLKQAVVRATDQVSTVVSPDQNAPGGQTGGA